MCLVVARHAGTRPERGPSPGRDRAVVSPQSTVTGPHAWAPPPPPPRLAPLSDCPYVSWCRVTMTLCRLIGRAIGSSTTQRRASDDEPWKLVQLDEVSTGLGGTLRR